MTTASSFSQAYQGLNSAQKEAVDAINGSVIVLAGPGSGKTQILGLRVAKILQDTDAQPQNILCLTFTDAAAKNMRDRLTRFIGGAANKVHITTFHALGNSIIQDNPRYFPFEPGFEPVSDIDKKVVLRKILQNLSHRTQFKSHHQKLGWIYIDKIASAIQDLKKELILPGDLETLLVQNAAFCSQTTSFLSLIPPQRISAKTCGWVETLIAACTPYCLEQSGPWPHYGTQCIDQLSRAHEHFVKTGKTTEITNWKTKYITKQDDIFCWKELCEHDRNLDLLSVYRQYQAALFENAWFDYEDMLISVVDALKQHDDLRYEYQERYQYVLVDEFQDTNQVQLECIKLLTDHVVHEGNPNLMVVGDDDQAIYKFQGANIANIHSFSTQYPQAVHIQMYQNYRSPQVILDLATDVIAHAQKRLDAEKKLVSTRQVTEANPITFCTYDTQLSQYHHIAKSINTLIASGVDPSTIAVIARKHSSLTNLIPHLNLAQIPYYYQKRLNILENQYVVELLTHLFFIHSISNDKQKIALDLLPDILRCAFWQIPREQIIAIAVAAHHSGKSWYEVIQSADYPQSSQVLTFLAELSTLGHTTPAQQLFNYLTGATAVTLADGSQYTSPFKTFYFGSGDIFDVKKQGDYLTFLSAIRALLDFVRTMKHTSHISLAVLLDIMSQVESVKSQIIDTSPFNQASQAVSLLTAHGSKGLEFDHVFLIDTVTTDWFSKAKHKGISFPLNLPIVAEKDDEDDSLRLFFVALTRAKQTLNISSFCTTDTGKQINQISYLTAVLPHTHYGDTQSDTIAVLEKEMLAMTAPPYTPDETTLLKGILENYKLSVTHLNNFLDLTRGGPYHFLEQNLLKFPQAIKAEPAYGSAIHTTLEHLSRSIQKNNTPMPLDILLALFEKDLKSRGLLDIDIAHLLPQGREHLTQYYHNRSSFFSQNDISEKNFSPEHVTIGAAILTGKIDRMIIDTEAKTIIPIDYKTGKLIDTNKSDTYNIIKRTKYYRQLTFYKLLIKNSRTFGDTYEVSHGILEFVDSPATRGSIFVVDHPISDADCTELTALITAVWQRIMTLDFPSHSQLEQFKNAAGEFDHNSNQQFCEYLLS